MNTIRKHSPYVSVIIPVYNDATELSETLLTLTNQSYPEDKYEVLVVDNGSTDTTVEVARSFAKVQLLIENKYKNSPYSARNRGLESAKGSVIAFLDASCRPIFHWLTEGINTLHRENADLVGGKVAFRLKNSKDVGEFYDSQINIKMKENIERRKGAKTANLFVRKKVIEAIGPFPEGIRSGGDLIWTQKASSSGFLLVYSEQAAVMKSARPLRELLKKQWRVGQRHPQIWKEQGIKKSSLVIILKMLIPPAPNTIKKILLQNDNQQGVPPFFSLWLTAYLVKIITSSANVYGKWKIQ
ncbi:MAG: glycosyltransferase [Cyclobacteriaceae bacterium]